MWAGPSLPRRGPPSLQRKPGGGLRASFRNGVRGAGRAEPAQQPRAPRFSCPFHAGRDPLPRASFHGSTCQLPVSHRLLRRFLRMRIRQAVSGERGSRKHLCAPHGVPAGPWPARGLWSKAVCPSFRMRAIAPPREQCRPHLPAAREPVSQHRASSPLKNPCQPVRREVPSRCFNLRCLIMNERKHISMPAGHSRFSLASHLLASVFPRTVGLCS